MTSERAPGPTRPFRHTPRDDLDQGPLDLMSGSHGHASTQSEVEVLQVAMRNAELTQSDLESPHNPQSWKQRMHAHGSGSPFADAHAIKKCRTEIQAQTIYAISRGQYQLPDGKQCQLPETYPRTYVYSDVAALLASKSRRHSGAGTPQGTIYMIQTFLGDPSSTGGTVVIYQDCLYLCQSSGTWSPCCSPEPGMHRKARRRMAVRMWSLGRGHP